VLSSAGDAEVNDRCWMAMKTVSLSRLEDFVRCRRVRGNVACKCMRLLGVELVLEVAMRASRLGVTP